MKKTLKKIIVVLVFYILAFMACNYFGRVFDMAYTNRAKAAGYLCAECLTDAECEKFCSK